jgi:hypothetical protein
MQTVNKSTALYVPEMCLRTLVAGFNLTIVVEQLATQSKLNLFIEFTCTAPDLYKQYLVLEAFSLAQ